MFWKNKPEPDSPPRPMVATFTFDLIDGKPDCDSIKMEEL